MGILKRADSGWMREEADYPPSFCVWDQDQQANPPLGEETRVKGKGGAGVVRRAKTMDRRWEKKEMTGESKKGKDVEGKRRGQGRK